MAVTVRVFADVARREARRVSTEDRVEIAEQIAGESAAEAPVESGEYAGGIHVYVAGETVAVVDDDPEAFWKEFGTVDTPAHASVTTAAKRYGQYSGMKPRRSR